MARRSDHSREELREMALSAAEQIVVEQGYEGLSARKVASAIGYTVGTLYLVFENIDDLILNINARTLDRLHAKMTASQAQPGCNWARSIFAMPTTTPTAGRWFLNIAFPKTGKYLPGTRKRSRGCLPWSKRHLCHWPNSAHPGRSRRLPVLFGVECMVSASWRSRTPWESPVSIQYRN